MTDYRAAAADYLTTRRAMGYKLVYQGQMLAQFVAYLDAADAEHLTIRHAVDWAKQPSSAARAWWAVRLSTVRAFARYLSALDPATEIPPPVWFPRPATAWCPTSTPRTTSPNSSRPPVVCPPSIAPTPTRR